MSERLATPAYVGIDAIKTYYKKYKQIDWETEVKRMGYSASTAYLAGIWDQKCVPHS